MNCVHGTRADKPCPDCEYEADQRAKGIITHVTYPVKKPGHACPRCGGTGTNADGMSSFGMRDVGAMVSQYRPPSKCHVCKGQGRVNITPIDEVGQHKSVAPKDDA